MSPYKNVNVKVVCSNRTSRNLLFFVKFGRVSRRGGGEFREIKAAGGRRSAVGGRRLTGAGHNLSEMDVESGSLTPLSAPFAPALNKGLIQNPCPSLRAKFGPNFWRTLNFERGEPVLGLPLSLSLRVSLSRNEFIDHTSIYRPQPRLQSKMASHSLRSPI
jgi:hypothetical protein